MKKLLAVKKYLFALLLFPVLLLIATPVLGQALINNPAQMQDMTAEVAMTGNLSEVTVGQLVARVIQVVLSLLGVIFLALTLVSGFKWMTAGGNEEQVKQATKTLKAAIIGLIIVLAAYSITYFIFTKLPFGMGGGGGFGTSG